MSQATQSTTEGIKAKHTRADVHGSTIIQPGDKVEIKGRFQRVIEVHEDGDDSQVTVHITGGFDRGVEKHYADSVTGYKSR